MKLRYESGIDEGAATRGPGWRRAYTSPNPLRPGHSLRLWVSRGERYEVALFDALGRRTRLMYVGPLAQGMHDFSLGQIPAGVYLLRVTTPGSTESQRLVVVE